MKSDFTNRYPDFATIERHIHRARAERAVALSSMIAEMIFGGARALRGLFTGPDAPVKRNPRGKLVARISAAR